MAGYGDGASDALGGRMKLVESKVHSKLFFHKDAVHEYMDMKYIMDELTEVREKVDQERHRMVAAARRELLAPMQEQLAAVKEELAAAKEELARKNKELDEKDEEPKAVRVKLQKHEAMKNQDEELNLNGTASDPVQIQPIRRQTRSMQREEKTSNPIAGHRASSNDYLEVLRDTMIKGFMELDGGHTIGVKEMGKLNEKPFQAACAEKLPPKEAETVASKLYSIWEKLLNSPSWKPFKTVAVGGNRQVIDVDDENLQELRREWGEGPYKSVLDALVERKEYHFDGTFAYDLWNYKERRKATLGECIEYMIDQVKQLKVARRRKSRRLTGGA